MTRSTLWRNKSNQFNFLIRFQEVDQAGKEQSSNADEKEEQGQLLVTAAGGIERNISKISLKKFRI